MPTDLLPELTTAYPVADDDVAAYRTNGHVRLSQLATREEAGAYRAPIAAGVERLSTETRPLDERDSYGMAFLQGVNLWRHDEGGGPLVIASPLPRGAPPPPGGPRRGLPPH